MQKRTRSHYIRVLAVLLAFVLAFPVYASAASTNGAQTRASDYLDSYNTYVCAMGSGKLQIWYTVMGVTDMDEIGVLSIKLYESTDNTNWTRVKTFSHENYSTMLAEDDWIHSSYVSYNGVAGRYYKAYVCIWAGKNGSGDTRYMWTSVERAT